MAERLLGTGVELRLLRDEGGWLGLVGQEDRLEARRLEDLLESGRGVLVETQVFVDLEDGGRRLDARDGHLGDLLGDLRIGGSDTTRWEFYAAPFRIELGDDLRERLRGSWEGREPHVRGGP